MNRKVLVALLILAIVTTVFIIFFTGSSAGEVSKTPNNDFIPETSERVSLHQQTTGAIKINDSNSASWTTYTNEEYKLTFRHPAILEEVKTDFSDTMFGEKPWKPIASFAGKENNSRIDVLLFDDSIENYTLVDKPGGSVYCFVDKDNTWYECINQPNKEVIRPEANGPKTIATTFEAYTYEAGSSGWASDKVLLPINNRGQVIIFHVYNWKHGYLEGKTKEYVDLASLASSITFDK